MPEFTLATANTYYGRMARAADGLQPFATRNVDVVTLQEVRDPENDTFQTNLERFNYRLVHAAPASGLAIAVRKDSHVKPVPNASRTDLLRTMRPFERRLYECGSRVVGQFPERGLIAARFVIGQSDLDQSGGHFPSEKGQDEVVIGTAHPLPPSRLRARKTQVRGIGQLLHDTYFADSVVVTGDWNHYPAPYLSDLAMRHAARLQTVDIGKAPTWNFHGGPTEWAGRLVSMACYPTSDNLSTFGRTRLEKFGGQLDAVLYRGGDLQQIGAEVVPIDSDHRAIVASFLVSDQAVV